MEIIPKKFVGLVYMSGDNDFVYYALSEKNKTAIEVVGPGNLVVFNRVRLEKNETQSKPYYLKYLLDDKLLYSKKIGPQAISKKIKYKGKLAGTPSKADKVVIEIPPGKHNLTFFKHRSAHKAHARFVFEKTEKLRWQEVLPESNLLSVATRRINSEKEKEYFRINNSQGFEFTPTGGSKLRVYLRADFNYKMHSQQITRLVLMKDGKVYKTYKMTCHKSNTSEYVTDKKLILGTLEKVYIDIPEDHNSRYKFLLKDTPGSVIIRVAVGSSSDQRNL
ncbi:MAG: hypothetical protein AAF489_08370 [Bacteroidota bacterium]